MTTNYSQPHDLDWAQLARYFAGDLPPGEARALEHWFDRDERSRRLLAEARAAWDASAAPDGWAPDADAGVRRLRQAVVAAPVDDADLLPTAPAPRERRPPRFIRHERRFAPVALAASLAALAISGSVFWSLQRTRAAAERPAPVALTEVTTSRGQRADVRLPDGSRVTLGVASRLRYPRDFGVGSRTVQLDGEAYFDVVHDDARPFRVRAGAGELEDVGTAFAVRAYGTPDMRVVVTEGIVVVRRPVAPKDSVVLTAGQLAEVDERGIARHGDVAVDGYVAWMRGELVFNDATLASVADELSRWYDIEVRVGDAAVAGRRFTGSFPRRPVDAVVREIAAAADVVAERAPGGWRFR